jgi:hypothetical protein
MPEVETNNAQRVFISDLCSLTPGLTKGAEQNFVPDLKKEMRKRNA